MYNYYLSRALARLGHRVTVVASRWSQDVPGHEEVGNIRIHRLLTNHRYWLHHLPVVGSRMRSVLQMLYSARVAGVLLRLQRRSKVDVVEFAEVGAEGYGYLHLPWRRPVVVRCHTPTAVLRRYYEPNEILHNTTWTEMGERYCIQRADRLTAPSRDMAKVIPEPFGVPRKRINAVPNPIDVDSFERRGTSNSKQRDSQDILVLHVGRLERVKGAEVLVQAIPPVLTQVPGTRFVFIGEDGRDHQRNSWRERLVHFLRERGVAGKVQFLGSVDQSTLIAWYHRADIAVVPSLNYESFSYTCAQAMAAGLPVIASRIGGIPETVDEGDSGILVKPGSVKELSQALVLLAQDRDLQRRMGEAGSRKARRCFDASVVAEQMVQVYASASGLKKKPGPSLTSTSRM